MLYAKNLELIILKGIAYPLIDCELLSKVYVNLIDQKEPKLNFSEKINDVSNNKKSQINFCKSIIQPTSKELKEHQDFLKKSLKKNYF